MKYLKKYKIFENDQSEIDTKYIYDIFLDFIDRSFSVRIYCNPLNIENGWNGWYDLSDKDVPNLIPGNVPWIKGSIFEYWIVIDVKRESDTKGSDFIKNYDYSEIINRLKYLGLKVSIENTFLHFQLSKKNGVKFTLKF